MELGYKTGSKICKIASLPVRTSSLIHNHIPTNFIKLNLIATILRLTKHFQALLYHIFPRNVYLAFAVLGSILNKTLLLQRLPRLRLFQ